MALWKTHVQGQIWGACVGRWQQKNDGLSIYMLSMVLETSLIQKVKEAIIHQVSNLYEIFIQIYHTFNTLHSASRNFKSHLPMKQRVAKGSDVLLPKVTILIKLWK